MSGVAAMLAVAAGLGAVPGELAGAESAGWEQFRPVGIPETASLLSVAAGPGGMVGIGSDRPDPDRFSDFVAWHSPDGRTWTETFRAVEQSGIPAAVVAAGNGFAAVMTRCVFPNAPGKGPDDAHCQPLAVFSADGLSWSQGTVQVDPPDPTVAEPSSKSPTGAELRALAAGPDGSLLGGGWMERRPRDGDATVWRSADGGRSWLPLPPGALPGVEGELDAVNDLTAVADGWLAVGESERDRDCGDPEGPYPTGNSSYACTLQLEPRLWRSADGAEWRSAPAPEHAGDLGHVVRHRSDSFVAGGSPKGVSIWRAGPEETWASTDGGFPRGTPPSSLMVLRGDDDGLVLAGIEPQQRGGKGGSVIWGSEDGATYRRTLLTSDPSWFFAAARQGDRWTFFGNTYAGDTSQLVAWTAPVRCAVGSDCGPVARLQQSLP